MDSSSSVAAGTPAPLLTVREILHPRSVAIVGASADEQKWGGRLLRYMLRHRMDGPLYPINARATELLGLPAYASLRDCPGPVDLAILLVPRHHVEQAIDDCVAKGVGCALCITAGFAETGQQGREDEARLVALARAGGVRLIGPNCMGLMNAHHNLCATTGVVSGMVERLPAGGIGLASQSGALMGAMISRGVDVGAGFSSTISVGNQADLDLNDFFEYLVDDPRTDVVCLYMEAVKDAARFTALLARAEAAGKPVCIAKAGRSEAGARAAASHTASLAGAWPAFEAVCRQYGAYLFESIYDLLQGAQLLQRGKRAAANGVALFSGSGGGGALLADALKDHGLELARLSPETEAAVANVLPATHRQLPFDFGMLNHTAPADPAVAGGAVGIALDRAMADPAVGVGILMLTTQPAQERVVEAAISAADRTDKPLLFVQGAGNYGDVARRMLRAAGHGYFDSPHDALKVAAALSQREASPPVVAAPAPALPADLPSGYLTEPAARRVLEAAGIPTTRWRFAADAAQAERAAREIGGSVAVKAVSPQVIHKSDMGGVRLNVQGDEAVRQACADIAASCRAAGVDALDGYLVTEMWAADAELILGIQRDPDFGPMVMVGAGGVLVELMKDVQLAPAPLSHTTARAMLGRLRSLPLLTGFRGRPPADLDRIADAIVRLGALAAGADGRVLELDINPLFVAGEHIVAADARVVLS
ncbi:acetate--CoA ligase family protein [Verticiella sediminum]|uniref:Acetate--CoA ligase family protein n=1 Tax=Verticiella sediminum TaxID=1247510 RepID=A0A556B126_9BURK|nr:acetate--CoA ligase family protein [Verticiella sediminum]TSH98844.1 acetate--CoA ligase family protein [Verticiella sediminum]